MMMPTNTLLSKHCHAWIAALSLLTAVSAQALTVELEWKPKPQSDLAGYRIHVGTASGQYTERIKVGKNATSATVDNLSDNKTYFFAITAFNDRGLESRLSHELSYPSPDPIQNLSARGPLHLDGVLITGFVITGEGQKRLMIRALGPSIPVSDTLRDPVLELRNNKGVTMASNDDWRMGGQEDAILASGLAPLNDKDAALIVTPDAGTYTVVVRDGEGGDNGVGLTEIYDLDDVRDTLRLSNSSARGSILTGDNMLIGGIVIGSGDKRTRILSRAIGPSLADFGVPYALGDPMLRLYDGNGTLIASNDDWQDTQEQEIAAVGVIPSDSRESAILAALAPGHYTALVSGKKGTMGIGLVELYSVP